MKQLISIIHERKLGSRNGMIANTKPICVQKGIPLIFIVFIRGNGQSSFEFMKNNAKCET